MNNLEITYEDPKPRILAEIESHKNEIVIFEGDLYRLIEFYDGNDDYYYKTIDLRGNTHYLSCVGRLLPLKKSLPDEEYNRLDDLFKLNYHSCDKEKWTEKKSQLNIIIDVDGTMYQTVGKPNQTMVKFIEILKLNLDCKIYAWSGGGEKYARQIVTKELNLEEDLFDGYFSKLEKLPFEPDITIDDEDYTDKGKINLKIIGMKE